MPEDLNTKVNQPELGTHRPTYNEINLQEETPRSSKRLRLDIIPEKGQQVEDLNYNIIINFMQGRLGDDLGWYYFPEFDHNA